MADATLSLQMPKVGTDLKTLFIDALRDPGACLGAVVGLPSATVLRIAAENVRNVSALNSTFAPKVGAFIAHQSPLGSFVCIGGVVLCALVAGKITEYVSENAM